MLTLFWKFGLASNYILPFGPLFSSILFVSNNGPLASFAGSVYVSNFLWAFWFIFAKVQDLYKKASWNLGYNSVRSDREAGFSIWKISLSHINANNWTEVSVVYENYVPLVQWLPLLNVRNVINKKQKQTRFAST